MNATVGAACVGPAAGAALLAGAAADPAALEAGAAGAAELAAAEVAGAAAAEVAGAAAAADVAGAAEELPELFDELHAVARTATTNVATPTRKGVFFISCALPFDFE
jgi:hypothetical protein